MKFEMDWIGPVEGFCK